MDLVPGQSLKTLARSTPMEPARAAAIVRALASAVEALHARSILHRDLKPENVIIRDDGEPVLLDFGLARHLDARTLTQSGALLGTPAYMAPEQAEGSGTAKLDERADVYGLGGILFELLAGRPPFEGTQVQILAAVLTKKPVWPDAPDALATVLRKAMEKAPDDRYPTARALGEDLARYLAGERVHARPARSRGPVLIVAVMIVGAAALALAFGRGQPEPAATPKPAREEPATTKATTTPRVVPKSAKEGHVAAYRTKVRELAARPGAMPTKNLSPLRHIEGPWEGKGEVVVRFLDDEHLVALGWETKESLVQLMDVNDDAPLLAPRWKREDTRYPRAWAVQTWVDGGRKVGFTFWNALHIEPFVPDAKTLVVSQPVASFPAGDCPFNEEPRLRGLAVSKDGRLLALGGSWGHVYLVETSGKSVGTIRVDHAVIALAFSPARRLAIAFASSVQIWDVGDGSAPKLVHEIPSLTGVRTVAFAPEGELLAIGKNPNVQLWSPDGERALMTQNFECVSALAFGGRRLLYGATSVTGRKNAVYAWRLDEPSIVSRGEIDAQVYSVDLSPDGTLLAVGTVVGSVELWPAW
jgi:hypothetical protein